ncbi:MAG: dihydrodipicolinate synthase family protein [Gemmatimonadetes bacterium]|nr:dihydrodipicolinate synthase family protein [Gemmatimonadota bacterium]MYH19358.1 dihydrodipicolinate synthase family protein [Gemmatimonadota bacterium]MYK99814.1 dihydrodipicolinate synthase family protein [Gemmatimonadota bacterium]
MHDAMPPPVRSAMGRGEVIPAHPLAVTTGRQLDERRQRALTRYYIAAGAGGLAVGVHTTQFEIRDPAHGLYEPVLGLAAEVMDREAAADFIRIAGICGQTDQATGEAEAARSLGYHAGLLSLTAMSGASEDELIAHCRAVADVIPVMGFYLQPAVGGLVLPYRFWRRFVELEGVVAIKIAAFNRYHTLDVLRALAESGRQEEITLYTGNDDNIVMDLLTEHVFRCADGGRSVRFKGGLLGHWAVWTRGAVALLRECHDASASGQPVPQHLLTRSIEVTDCNAAFFDPAHGFAGCIPGIHEVLRRQGLLEGTWCLNPDETLSPGQYEEISRVYSAYPHLNDDHFVAEHRDDWLR